MHKHRHPSVYNIWILTFHVNVVDPMLLVWSPPSSRWSLNNLVVANVRTGWPCEDTAENQDRWRRSVRAKPWRTHQLWATHGVVALHCADVDITLRVHRAESADPWTYKGRFALQILHNFITRPCAAFSSRKVTYDSLHFSWKCIEMHPL